MGRSGKGKRGVKAEGFLKLCATLAEDEEFSALLTHKNSESSVLNAYAFSKAQNIPDHGLNLSSIDAFTKIKTLLGSYSYEQLPPSVQVFHRACRNHTLQTRKSRQRSEFKKNRIAKRIGFHPSVSTSQSVLPEPIFLSKLSMPHPTPKAYIYEQLSNKPKPPKVTDISCGKCDLMLPLIESRLQCSIPATDSAVIRDSTTKTIVAVVIRNLAKDYYDIIKPWAIDLINDSIDRRNLSQRNGPGKLARVGVTDGPRSARVFGWSRSLKTKFKQENQSDHDVHERNISALFGLFYSLLQANAPREIITDLESAMTSAGLPRLDFDKRMQFPLPFFTEDPITFYGYPLSPPEGYIARNFSKQIHTDKHWTKCPWGAYWNFKRETPNGEYGMKHGANFFIADYGLRIVNSENVCVIWDISLNHGTSWYYDGLEHVGIAFVLSPTTEKAWDDYKKRVERGEIKDGFSIIEDDIDE